MMMTRMGCLPSADTFRTINPPRRESTPPTDYDFGLPPGLQLVPQRIEFIDPDADAPDFGEKDQFAKRHQPETPQADKANNPFSAKAKLTAKLKTSKGSKAFTQQPVDYAQSLERIKKEIEPLLADHKKRSPYPKKVIQLTRKAARNHPEMNTKRLAETLGIPYAIVYYWLGYNSYSRHKKEAQGLPKQTD